MSKIIGVTVGTTINPNKFGVSEYNDLANKPITYLKNIYLDKLTDTGVYVIDGYDITLGTGDRTTYTQQVIVIIRQEGSDKYQYIWTPTEYITRRHSGTAWNMVSVVKYKESNEVIKALTKVTNEDGTHTFKNLVANSKYSIEISKDCSFILPSVTKTEFSSNRPNVKYADTSILIYTSVTAEVSIDWGTDVMFYNNEIPEIGIGYYDIIFTFDPNAEKWCVGVISKGAGV